MTVRCSDSSLLPLLDLSAANKYTIQASNWLNGCGVLGQSQRHYGKAEQEQFEVTKLREVSRKI